MKTLAALLFFLSATDLLIASELTFEKAEIRVLPTKNLTAATVTIKNLSDKKFKLIKVEGNFAKTFEIHTMEKIDGIMKMRTLENLEIPPKSSIELKSGGLHLMIFELNDLLKKDSTYTMNLFFEPNKVEAVEFKAVAQ